MRHLIVSFCTLLLTCSSVAADVPVEGDRALLQILLDAQATNRTLFRRGEMNAEVRATIGDVRAKIHVIWAGENTFWDYTLWEVIKDRKGNDLPRVERVKMIETPAELIWYSPEANLVQRIRDQSMSYRPILNVRPGDVWFRMDGGMDRGRGAGWEGYLDPARVGDYVMKFVVRKVDGDQVVVERHHTSGSIYNFTASLRAGGNIIAYTTTPPPDNMDRPIAKRSMLREGSFEWAQDQEGNWYPRRIAWRRPSWGDPEQPDFDYLLQISDFNPNPVIPPDRFKFASLKPEQGTTVEEVGGKGRTYRIGKKQQPEETLQQSILERLAEKLKAGGFAAPEKKK